MLSQWKRRLNDCFQFLNSAPILLLEKRHLASQILPTEDPKMPTAIKNVIFKNFPQLMKKENYFLSLEFVKMMVKSGI